MRFVCQICGYIYDEATDKCSFASLQDSWKCPLCGASKSDFKAEAVKTEITKPNTAPVVHENLKKLSIGQLAAVFSNLSKGCEKQFKGEEAGLFRQLAEYFTDVSPATDDADVKTILSELQEDIDNYPALRLTADGEKDRGAARVCVWGEKVTRIAASLIRRYIDEGEKLLEGTNIWVCTACGFVYVGDEAPELCPVCKVPSWKFEKIEGRA